MTDARQAALDYAHKNRDRFLQEYHEFLRIPSISTNDENRPDMQRAAEWVAGQLRSIGMNNVKVFPTGRHPIVYAEWLEVEGAPTMLVYGHYDVQPVDPLELWTSAPFEPTRRGDDLFARGASDMKGQVAASLMAIESVVRAGGLPVNLKFLIEGEEEIGSPSLEEFLVEHKDLLASDFALNPDAGMLGKGLPTISYALRRIAYFELRVFGPDHDLHSGSYGGAVHNPAQVLIELVAGMHDAQGRVTLPGFYDKVRPLGAEERAAMALLPKNEAYFKSQAGVSELFGEAGYTPAERVGARPTLEVNGLLSGFTGQGSKTVLPAKAMAKISMRLVPDQDPAEIKGMLTAYLEEHAPNTVRWELTDFPHGAPSISDTNTPFAKALSAAMQTVWGREPLFDRVGGSVPIVAQMQRILGIDSLLTGFGLPDDNLHAPNEKQNLPTWFEGIDALIHFLHNLKG